MTKKTYDSCSRPPPPVLEAEQTAASPFEIEHICEELRNMLSDVEGAAREMMNHSVYQQDSVYPGQHSEMKAQTMLSVRHIEDAQMRLGKVCQYADDGVSIFDK